MTGLTRKQVAALVGVSAQPIVGWQSSGYLHQPYTAEKVLAAQQAVHIGERTPITPAEGCVSCAKGPA